jgi:hypothetical protein
VFSLKCLRDPPSQCTRRIYPVCSANACYHHLHVPCVLYRAEDGRVVQVGTGDFIRGYIRQQQKQYVPKSSAAARRSSSK